MAFTDLSTRAQDGLAYAANKIKDYAGEPKFANARAYGDFVMESNGLEWYAKKQEAARLRRIKALEDPANAALASQVDAVAGGD